MFHSAALWGPGGSDPLSISPRTPAFGSLRDGSPPAGRICNEGTGVGGARSGPAREPVRRRRRLVLRTGTTSHRSAPGRWIVTFSRSDRESVPRCPPSSVRWDVVPTLGHAGRSSRTDQPRIPRSQPKSGEGDFRTLSATQNPFPTQTARRGGFRADPGSAIPGAPPARGLRLPGGSACPEGPLAHGIDPSSGPHPERAAPCPSMQNRPGRRPRQSAPDHDGIAWLAV